MEKYRMTHYIMFMLVGLTDAVAKAGREGNEGIRMSTSAIFWQETLRTELFRVREEAGVSVKSISYNDDICSFRNFIAIYRRHTQIPCQMI